MLKFIGKLLKGEDDPAPQNTIKEITEVVNETLLSNTSVSAGKVDVSQELDFSGDGNVFDGVSMKQSMTFKQEYASGQQGMNELINNLETKLIQYAEKKGVAGAGFLEGSSAGNLSELKTDISNNITAENISECIQTFNAKQELSVSGNNNVATDIDMDQELESTLSCMNEQLLESNSITKLKNEIDQKAKKEEENIMAPITEMVGEVATSPVMLIFGFIIIIFLIIFSFSLGGDEQPAFMPIPMPMQNPYGPMPMPMQY